MSGKASQCGIGASDRTNATLGRRSRSGTPCSESPPWQNRARGAGKGVVSGKCRSTLTTVTTHEGWRWQGMNVGFGTSSGLNPTFIASRSRLRWLGNGQRSDRSDQHTARNGNHAESEPVYAAPAGVLAVRSPCWPLRTLCWRFGAAQVAKCASTPTTVTTRDPFRPQEKLPAFVHCGH